MSSGYIIPISLYLSPTFAYENDYCSNAILTKIETNAHFIIIKDGYHINKL